MKHLLGVDIGGTKCAVCLGTPGGDIVSRSEIPTAGSPDEMLRQMGDEAAGLVAGLETAPPIGIVCGGPLDVENGRIMSPPNLPGWDEIPVVEYFLKRFGVSTYLQNDANAGALAEWKYGAGMGCRNMMFCTMGTGFGCGLILNGSLYSGGNGNAGELGHVRLTASGPVGYGKEGSVEGWCSGGGIAQIARSRIDAQRVNGGQSILFKEVNLSAKAVAEAASRGDELAISVFNEVGEKLGSGLAMAIDLLNLETIILGGIFARQEAMIRPSMETVLKRECLNETWKACSIRASGLGERIGDVAALTVALEGMES